jgi:hypothetical protein
MEKTFNVFRLECGTLKKEFVGSISKESLKKAQREDPIKYSSHDDLTDARRLGETRYAKPNHFIGVEAVLI